MTMPVIELGEVSRLNKDLTPLGATARAGGRDSGSDMVVTLNALSAILTSVVVTGLVAGALGVPLGVALHGWVIPAMGDSVGLRLPGSVTAVYHAVELLPLTFGGLFIAALGAFLPAGWAARARTATALRTE